LAVSGMLNREMHGEPVPVMADRTGQWVIGIENLNAGRPGDVIPMNGSEFRRSVYVQVRRSRPLAVLDTFDLPRMDPNCTKRVRSTVAPQALMMMNSDFVIAQARYFAERLQKEKPENLAAQVSLAWKLAFTESIPKGEIEAAVKFVNRQTKEFQSQVREEEKADDAVQQKEQKLAALASFCQVLLSTNQFLYTE